MNRTERFFIVAVLLFAIIFTVTTAIHTGEIIERRAALHTQTGVAGQARDIDVEQIRQLIRQQRLSNHEALFYTDTSIDHP